MVVARLLALAVSLGVATASAHAQSGASDVRAPRSEFWREVAEPRYRRSRTLLRHATTQLRRYDEQPGETGPAQRRALLEAAIHRLELALRIAPDDAEILYQLARAKQRWVKERPGGGEERLDDEAIAIYERLRAIDPEYEPFEVAFELGVLHTRAHRFDEAAREYERAMAQAPMFDMPESMTALANLAEVTMLSGDVARAAQHYERAVEGARRAGATAALPLWGLAVALDRLGEHRAALDRAREALGASQGGTEILRSEGVFFEPAYEIHWYEAIGAEAIAEMEADAQSRRDALARAVASWEAFLTQSDGESRWEEVARANLERVRAALRRGR